MVRVGSSAATAPEPETIQERWFSLEEIAVHLGMNRYTIYKWIERRQILAHKLGKRWKFKISEIDAWIIVGEAAGNDGEGKTQYREITEDVNTTVFCYSAPD